MQDDEDDGERNEEEEEEEEAALRFRGGMDGWMDGSWDGMEWMPLSLN